MEPLASASGPHPMSKGESHISLHIICAILCAGMAAWQAWLARNTILNGDGYAYLRFARSLSERDVEGSINAFFSPLYPWLLLRLDPSVGGGLGSGFEGQLLMLANYLDFLAAAICFYVFWRQLERLQAEGNAFRGRWFVLFGWGLLYWSCAELMLMFNGFTDRLAAALIYATAALLTILREKPRALWIFPLLGWCLGLGYLAKSAQFPLGAPFLVAALWLVRDSRRMMMWGGLLTVVAFLSLAYPWIHAISIARQRWTFGDAGLVNYATSVEQVPDFWPCGLSSSKNKGCTVLRDYPELLVLRPGFSSEYWNDFSLDTQDYHPRVVPMQHAEVLLGNLRTITGVLLYKGLGWIVALAILFWLARPNWSLRRIWANGGYLLIPALAAFAAYLSIYVEGRYLAPYAVLLVASLLSGLEVPQEAWRGWPARAAVGLAFCYGLLLAGTHLYAFTASGPKTARTSHELHEISRDLARLGVNPRDPLACLWGGMDTLDLHLEFTAHLRCAVMSGGFNEEQVEQIFLRRSRLSDGYLEQFASLGCKTAIRRFTSGKPPTGWQPAGRLDVYVYPLDGLRK
jgi:hypothetical protein